MPANPPSGPTITPAPLKSAPPGPAGDLRAVKFEGTVQLFTGGMPEGSFVDFSDTGGHPVFACCWVDRERGKSVQVVFPEGGGPGVFRVDIDFRDHDSAKLKVLISMRMRDESSGNRRTVPLCSSCAFMAPMLKGETDSFQMLDVCYDSNYARVAMSITNHQDFVQRPLILRASHLDRLPEFNQKIHCVAEAIAENNAKNNTKFTQGGGSMQSGESRYHDGLPRLQFVLFILLLLGTPAHVFLLTAQPPVQRKAKPQDR